VWDDAVRAPHRARDEAGFALVWFAVVIMMLLGVAAFLVDLMHGYAVAQQAQNAADAGALAGVVSMPDEASAFTRANQTANKNISGATVTPNAAGSDQLEVTVSKEIDTFFGGILGVPELTVTRTAVAQYDAVNTAPVDIVVILDRTSSMTSADLTNVKNASRALLQYLDPAHESVALGVLGPSGPTTCSGGGHGLGVGRVPANNGPPDPNGRWMASPFGTGALWQDYQNANGTVNVNSDIAKTINCLTTSSVGTDLGSPLQAALAFLNSQPPTTPAHHKGIILMTDGAANEPLGTTPNPCQYALNAATAAKNAGVQLITIGFGIENKADTGNQCHDATGTYRNTSGGTGPWVGPLLQAMASGGPVGTTECNDAENTDGDAFFCQRSNLDLSKVFVDAAAQLTQRAPRLVR
jgi:Flp pilus assembly protein TadG